MISKQNKGMGLLSVLTAIALFGLIFLVFTQWASQQRKSAVKIYRLYQAVQIAENQIQRQFLGLNCENIVQQNGHQFHIACKSDTVSVSDGQDEILIKTQ
ncbi:DUF5374 domain-containing protein [Rodentibacter caecimuris]|uniref:Type II secretory pathway, pseudopilin n=1 Tax=Rodentibacter caecimuris TaxID=1796644 RepID=A0ABX3KZF1_9PAST|nr:hypothetical protein BKG89_03840 [Rodentibacter heylii]